MTSYISLSHTPKGLDIILYGYLLIHIHDSMFPVDLLKICITDLVFSCEEQRVGDPDAGRQMLHVLIRGS